MTKHMLVIAYVIFSFIIICGLFFKNMKLTKKYKTSGILKIYTSRDENPIFLAELNVQMSDLLHMDDVILKIENVEIEEPPI